MGKKKKKLPKEIAGVKIPKKLRKKGGRLLAALDTPVGRELAAAGLMAAAAALARRRKAAGRPEPGDAARPEGSGEPEAPAKSEKPEAGAEAGPPAGEDAPSRDPHAAGAEFASVAAGVAAAALDRWLRRRRAHPPGPPEPPDAPEPPPGAEAH